MTGGTSNGFVSSARLSRRRRGHAVRRTGVVQSVTNRKGLVYYRLHGSPNVYHSSYSDEFLEALAKELTRAASRECMVRLRQHGSRCRHEERASGS